MSEQPNPDELGTTKDHLAHVETKTGSTAKPIFKCQDCDYVQDIPGDILKKMELDEPFDTPSHHDKPMNIGVVG